MEWLVVWFFGAIVVGFVARARGHSLGGFILLSTIFSPLISLLIAVALPQVEKDAPTRDTHVKCPECRELVLRDARVCKHCGCRLVPQ